MENKNTTKTLKCKFCEFSLGAWNKSGFCNEHRHGKVIDRGRKCLVCKKRLFMNNEIGLCRKHRRMTHEAREKEKSYRFKNLAHHKETAKKWRELNREKIISRSVEYQRNRFATDPNFRLMKRLRERTRPIRKTFGGGYETTKEILGADLNIVRKHIENQFKEGMCWKNYGEWHVDHIIPLSSAKSLEQAISLCNYTNLQPLWAEENHRKGAKILSKSGIINP